MSRIEGLVGTLVERYSLSRTEAEEFVTSIFGVVRDSLDKDKIVKVKGLGTFKLADVNARESIDVNTKERIVIEGRAKISFTPENAVRDRINSPFSQFETVDLDDDVDFSSIDDKYKETTVTDKPVEVGKEEVMLDTSVSEPVSEPVPEPVSVPESKSASEPASEAESEFVSESAQDQELEDEKPEEVDSEKEPTSANQKSDEPKQEGPSPEEEPQVESKPRDEESQAEKEPHEKESSEPVLGPQVTVPARNPFCEELIREGITHSREIIRLLYLLLALVVIVLLIGAVCLGYKMGSNAALKEAAPVKPAPRKVVVVKKKPAATKPVEKIIPVDTVKQAAKATRVAQAVQKVDTLAMMQEQYNKDARVRTGAYCIVGLDKVVKVREGQTFEGICRTSLGEGMECYVEVFNAGKKEYKAGDEIKIPLLKLKKRMKRCGGNL